jgi:hypothetical protein
MPLKEDAIVSSKKINSRTLLDNVTLYPNPATGTSVNLEYRADYAGSLNVKLFNVSGQMVLKQDCGTIPPGTEVVRIDIANLQNGAYFVFIQFEDKISTHKLIKLK